MYAAATVNLPNLRNISLTNISVDRLTDVTRLTGLSSLTLSHMEEMPGSLAILTGLRELCLPSSKDLAPAGFPFLRGMTALTSLDLRNTYATDLGVLSSLKSLAKLVVDDSVFPHSVDHMASLTALTKLEVFMHYRTAAFWSHGGHGLVGLSSLTKLAGLTGLTQLCSLCVMRPLWDSSAVVYPLVPPMPRSCRVTTEYYSESDDEN